MENETPRKKLAEMTPEERRIYNAQKKALSRQRKKLAVHVFTADEWRDEFPKQHPTLASELNQHAEQFAQSVLSELQVKSSDAIDGCLDQVARSLLGLNRGWLRDVEAPAGQMVSGMYFPDALGSTIVHDSHRFEMERSQTYSAAYRELLIILNKLYGHENTEHAHAIKAELEGTYVLPIPEPPIPSAPEPAVPEPQKLPTDAEILERGRIQLLDQIHNPLLSNEARNFLYGN